MCQRKGCAKFYSLVPYGTSRYFEDTQIVKNCQWQPFFCIFHSLMRHVSASEEAFIRQIRHKRDYCILKEKETNLMSLVIVLYFTSSMLNMFRTLIHPSSGACVFSIVGCSLLHGYQPSHTQTPTYIETRTHDQCDDTIEKSQACKLPANLYDIYYCCVYSEKLLMMDRGTVRNM